MLIIIIIMYILVILFLHNFSSPFGERISSIDFSVSVNDDTVSIVNYWSSGASCSKLF